MCALSVDAGKSGASSRDADSAVQKLPSQARVVVVGGGVIGCSVAYHLTRMGIRDVVLLERKSLGCGTTWHSHGVVGLTRANPTLLRMAMETVRMISDAEALTGKSAGYSARGSINVTEDPSRLIQFSRFADVANSFGLEARIIGAAEAHELYPLMDPAGIIGALHVPSEGQCNPLDLTQTLAAAARVGGARVIEGVTVTGAQIEAGRIRAIETEQGDILCENLVNCTGLWGRDFLRAETGGLPIQGLEHNYLVTDFSSAIGPNLPLLRDPDKVMTLREDNGQYSVGFNEKHTNIFAPDEVPADFAFDELPPDWDGILPYLEEAAKRIPILNDLGVRLFLCGPEGATPDTRYLLGPSPDIDGYFIAAGFCGTGIGSSGGAGRVIAEWIANGQPDVDPWNVDFRRMAPGQANRNYLATRTIESNGKLFPMAWPHRQNLTARNLRRSPLHGAMKSVRACFIEEAGWELPEWFAPEGVAPEPVYSFERPAWFPHARAEAQAALSDVAFADRSMTGKALLVGAQAGSAFAAVFGVEAPRGAALEVTLMRPGGGIEGRFTAVPRDRGRILLLGEVATQRRDLAALERAFAAHPGVSLVEITAALAMIEVIGPNATELLRASGWRGNPEATFDAAAEIGHVTSTAFATAGFGLPAWVLLTGAESADALLAALRTAKPAIRPIGMHARHALLTRAGSALWGQALSSTITVGDAGLSDQDGAGRLCLVTLDDPEPVLLGAELVRNAEHVLGRIVQPAYALCGPAAQGLALLSDVAPSGPLACEVQIAGLWHAAKIG